jgi:hypothetical protein
MAQLIQFYIPTSFKSPKTRWMPLDQRGKVIEFPTAAMKKSA